MQISVSITPGPDDTLPEPDEIAQRVLTVLDGDEGVDHCTVYLVQQPVVGQVGAPPSPPEPPAVQPAGPGGPS
jgi:hypothetical protein